MIERCGHGVPMNEDCPACDANNRESDAVPERDPQIPAQNTEGSET